MRKTPRILSIAPERKNKQSQAPIPMQGVDVLSDVLNELGLSTRLFCHSELQSPWAMGFTASELAHFHYMERGGAWLVIPGAAPIALHAGDLVVLPRGKPYALADAPSRKPVPFDKLIPQLDDGRCALIRHGGTGAASVMLCGAFSFRRSYGNPLLPLLPEVLHMPPTPETTVWLEHTLRQLAREARSPTPGSETVVSRLTDVLFVQVLRAWLAQARRGEVPPGSGWLQALVDPKIGRALSLMHGASDQSWTVPALARAIGMSRSPFAARFLELVGETPKRYLVRLRLRKAAFALSETSSSMPDIAAIGGYGSEPAFSKAFSAEFGMSPGKYRVSFGTQRLPPIR